MFLGGEASTAGGPPSATGAAAGTRATAKAKEPTGNQAGPFRQWRDGLSKVDRRSRPMGYPVDLWSQLGRDGATFLDSWGATALALGWSTLDLFGVHGRAPVTNYSAMGLVPLLRGSVVIAMTVTTATLQRGAAGRLMFRRQPYCPDAKPVWELCIQRERLNRDF